MGCINSKNGSQGRVRVRTVDTFQTNLVRSADAETFSDVYEVGKLLGRGITGSVHEVTHKSTGRKYAMKSINLENVDDAQIKELRTEIMILKQLDHPNIVKLFEVYEDQNERSMKLVMELLTGGHLGLRALNGEAELRRVVKQIVSACRYFHSRGVCHRDLKLENILWCNNEPNSSVKIIDFGLGTVFYSAERLLQRQHMLEQRGADETKVNENDNLTDVSEDESDDDNSRDLYIVYQRNSRNRRSAILRKAEPLGFGAFDSKKTKNSDRNQNASIPDKFMVSGKAVEKSRILRTACGTAYYMPPELVVESGKGYDGEKMDMWAVGVTTYALITKRPPFVGKNARIVYENIRRCRPSYSGSAWSTISPEAMRFVQCCLVANPEIRYSAEAALRSSWLTDAPQTPSGTHVSDNFRLEIFNALCRFASYSSLKKSAMLVFAHRLYDVRTHQLSACFHEIDASDNGFIVYDDLSKFLSQMNQKLSKRRIRRIYKAVDQDRTGAVTYLEFIAACLEISTTITAEMAADAFDHLDQDNRGKITHESLTKLLGHGFTKEEIRVMIREVDKSRSGHILKKQFISIMLENTVDKALVKKSSPEYESAEDTWEVSSDYETEYSKSTGRSSPRKIDSNADMDTSKSSDQSFQGMINSNTDIEKLESVSEGVGSLQENHNLTLISDSNC